uniref:Trans-Golgi network integral membrane protein 2 n=1 Tax=Steinernema glaseri TaxID=37863 RepID=A0A1I7YB22_9BILA
MTCVSFYFIFISFSIFLLTGVSPAPTTISAKPRGENSVISANHQKNGSEAITQNEPPGVIPEELLNSVNTSLITMDNGTLSNISNSDALSKGQKAGDILPEKGEVKKTNEVNVKDTAVKKADIEENGKMENEFSDAKVSESPKEQGDSDGKEIENTTTNVESVPDSGAGNHREANASSISIGQSIPDYASLGEAENTHFMTFLVFISACVAVGYVGFQYRRKIKAIVHDRMNGGRNVRRTRATTARYERLHNSLLDDDEDIIY